MSTSGWLFAGVVVAASGFAGSAGAATVMQQCGAQYQAAKAANTLNGMTWNQFRTDCAAKLKAEPAGDVRPAPAPEPAAAPVANPLKPAAATPAPEAAPAATTAAAPPAAVTTKTTAPATGGRAAMLTRERQCGAEWRAQKVSLVAQTPGLTWPKYWSQCNTRLKAAGQ